MNRSQLLILAAAGAAVLAARPTTSMESINSPVARLLVLDKEDAALAIVNPDTGAVLAKVPTGQQPHEVVTSSDGKLAFTSNYGTGQAPGHTISMIDIPGQKGIREIDVAPLSRPHGLWFANGKLYFTAEANRKIARYDPSAGRIDWDFETGQDTTHMIVLSRDGRTIFTSNIGSDSVSMIQQGPGGVWAQTVIAVSKGPEGIDLAPTGREVWSAGSRDGGVSVIDTASRRVSQTLNIATKRSNRIKLTPDGRFALVSDVEAGELVVLDAQARKVVRRLPLGRQPEGILVQPDGTRAFVAVNGDNLVAMIDLKSWQVTRKIPAGAGPDGMAWIP